MNKSFFSILLLLVLLSVTTSTACASDLQTCIKNRTGHSLEISLRCGMLLLEDVEFIEVPNGKELCGLNNAFGRKYKCRMHVQQQFSVCYGDNPPETICIKQIDYCYETITPNCEYTDNYCQLDDFLDNGRLKSDSFAGHRCKMHKY